jgi:hypothetical protein
MQEYTSAVERHKPSVTTRPHLPRLVLLLTVALAACSSSPSPTPTATTAVPAPTPIVSANGAGASAAPSASPAIGVDCGPLSGDDCTLAVAVGEPYFNGSIISIRIMSPSATATCSPGGGSYPGTSGCDVIAIVTTTSGEISLSLIRNGTNWLWTGAIR